MRRLPDPSLVLVMTLFILQTVPTCTAWSNGGYSDDLTEPDYGTHDWIAEHAKDWLPANMRALIDEHLKRYLYGTEFPDLYKSAGGFGDSTNHHIYYNSDGSLQSNSSAVRAEALYQEALACLMDGELENASIYAGAMAHYIADVAAFGHVMGKYTHWGAEPSEVHSEYEDEVNDLTGAYESELNSYLIFDGSWDTVSAYEAACMLAYDTTFGDGVHDCLWMNATMDFDDPEFMDRYGESLNLAVNYVTEALYTLYSHYSPPSCCLIVHVADSSEGPIQGAEVISTAQPEGQEALSGSTDSNGEASFEGIISGEYVLSVSKGSYDTESDTISVEGEEPIQALFILVKGNGPEYTWVIIVLVGGSILALAIKRRE